MPAKYRLKLELAAYVSDPWPELSLYDVSEPRKKRYVGGVQEAEDLLNALEAKVQAAGELMTALDKIATWPKRPDDQILLGVDDAHNMRVVAAQAVDRARKAGITPDGGA